MADKKKFLLRISGDLYTALEKWAADELRSVNAQVEYLLTESAKKSGRMKSPATNVTGGGPPSEGKAREE